MWDATCAAAFAATERSASSCRHGDAGMGQGSAHSEDDVDVCKRAAEKICPAAFPASSNCWKRESAWPGSMCGSAEAAGPVNREVW